MMTDELIRPLPSDDALANGLFGSRNEGDGPARICEMDASRFASLYADPGLHLCSSQTANDSDLLLTA